MQTKKTVYLAGKITGDPLYRDKFYVAAAELEKAGFAVINPATLPANGFCYAAYMRISTTMLDECEAICLLPDWKSSEGAVHEYNRAALLKKEIFFYRQWKEMYDAGWRVCPNCPIAAALK